MYTNSHISLVRPRFIEIMYHNYTMGQVLVFTASHLRVVFKRLRRVGLKMNAEKLSFFVPEIKCLGHILTKDDINPVQKKVQAILDIQPPTTLKQLRSFLGMV